MAFFRWTTNFQCGVESYVNYHPISNTQNQNSKCEHRIFCPRCAVCNTTLRTPTMVRLNSTEERWSNDGGFPKKAQFCLESGALGPTLIICSILHLICCFDCFIGTMSQRSSKYYHHPLTSSQFKISFKTCWLFVHLGQKKTPHRKSPELTAASDVTGCHNDHKALQFVPWDRRKCLRLHFPCFQNPRTPNGRFAPISIMNELGFRLIRSGRLKISFAFLFFAPASFCFVRFCEKPSGLL